jgi:hypothetical protein
VSLFPLDDRLDQGKKDRDGDGDNAESGRAKKAGGVKKVKREFSLIPPGLRSRELHID